MTGRIDLLLEAARDRIAAWLPELAECAVHDGRVDIKEARRVGLPAPCVRVALLEAREISPERYPDAEAPGAATAVLRLGAFALALDKSRDESGWKAARAMAERIAVGVALDSWSIGVPRGRPSQIRIASQFGSELDNTGLAVVAVAWEQELELAEPGTAAPSRPLPAELYRSFGPGTGGYDRLVPEESP